MTKTSTLNLPVFYTCTAAKSRKVKGDRGHDHRPAFLNYLFKNYLIFGTIERRYVNLAEP